MSQIRLVADSSCDLLSLDGVVFVSVPLTLRTETEEFRDDARLDVDAMVATLRATKGRSYSACPNVADWEKAFGESGDVLAFTITSSLSGSYGAACVAKPPKNSLPAHYFASQRTVVHSLNSSVK